MRPSKTWLGPDLLEHVLRDFSKSRKGLLQGLKAHRCFEVGCSEFGLAVLSETAGAGLWAWLNALHRRVETVKGRRFGVPRPVRTLELRAAF